MAEEFGAEMTRVFARAWWEGAATVARALARQDAIEGRTPRSATPPVVLAPRAIRRLTENGYRLGADLARGIWVRLAPAIESAFAPDGRQLKTLDDLEAEIRAIYATDYLRRSTLSGEDVLALAAGHRARTIHLEEVPKAPRGKAVKIGDPKGFVRWQGKAIPYSAWLKSAAASVDENGHLPELTLKALSAWVETERTRYHNLGGTSAALADPGVVTLTYSAIRDSRTCPVCLERDGVTRPKTDAFWSFNTPPMHHGCRCSLIPGTAREGVAITPEAKLPNGLKVAVGYGKVDPVAQETAKALGTGVPVPKGSTGGKGKAFQVIPGGKAWRETVPAKEPGFLLPSKWSKQPKGWTRA